MWRTATCRLQRQLCSASVPAVLPWKRPLQPQCRQWCSAIEKRAAAIEAQRKLEVQCIFDSLCQADVNGVKYLDQAGLKRLLIGLGHSYGSPELSETMSRIEKKYGLRMALEELQLESDSFCRLNSDKLHDCMDELADAFSVYDRDGSGSISPEELMTMLSTTGSQMTLEQARQIIAIFDRNGDGHIDFDEFCSLLEEGIIGWRFRTGYRVVFVCGGPGSGKGTLAERLARRVGVGHVSTGELLRRQSEADTDLGKELREIMRKGGLVSPHVVMRMLREFLQSQPGKRVLIDGFPRSVANLVDFEAVCGRAEFVLWFDCPDEVLIQRLLARGRTSGRADDQDIEIIKKRLAVYHSVQEPLERHFRENGYRILRIDASKSVPEVEEQLLNTPEFRLELQRKSRQNGTSAASVGTIVAAGDGA